MSESLHTNAFFPASHLQQRRSFALQAVPLRGKVRQHLVIVRRQGGDPAASCCQRLHVGHSRRVGSIQSLELRL